MNEVKKRIAPFIALLDAKYLPLLFAVAPQAYSVYLWLFPHPYDGYGEVFAIMGALGFEWVYVGAIAWADEGKSSFWTWATALVALAFSVMVAYHVHEATEHNWAWLHAGFPLVAFTYTINMYVATNRKLAVHQNATTVHLVAPQLQASDENATTAESSLQDDATRVVYLRDELKLTWDQVASEIGKSRTWVTQLYTSKKRNATT